MLLRLACLATLAAMTAIHDVAAVDLEAAPTRQEEEGDTDYSQRFLRTSEVESAVDETSTHADPDDEERALPSMTKGDRPLILRAEAAANAGVAIGASPRMFFRGFKLKDLPRDDPKWLFYSKLKKAYKLKNPNKFKRHFRPKMTNGLKKTQQ